MTSLKNQRPRRVLIVDDDTGLIMLIKSHLPSREFIVEQASGVKEALKAVSESEQPYDVAFIDLWLPATRFDKQGAQPYLGFQLAEQLASSSPSTKLIAMSLFGNKDVAMSNSGRFFSFVDKGKLVNDPKNVLSASLGYSSEQALTLTKGTIEMKGKVDFAIITIRRDEFEAVLQRFRPETTISGQREYNLSRITTRNGQQYTCAVVRSLFQGNQYAQATANAIIEDLDPQWILVVGIAGGVPSNDFTLGDVILSSFIYDMTVAAEKADGSKEYDLRGGYVHPEVQAVLANMHDQSLPGWNSTDAVAISRPSLNLRRMSFDDGIDAEWRKKVSVTLRHHFQDEKNSSRNPIFREAPIASSDRLIRNTDLIGSWRQIARRIEAVEMEAAGVYNASQRRERSYPVLSIRGISDIIGFRRGDDWLSYACHTAAAFAYAFVCSEPIRGHVVTPYPASYAMDPM